jgi:ureidoacrylate peracid hydrolase
MDARPGNLPSRYAAKALRPALAERLAPQRTALVVVDMQNDFCAPGGYIDQLGLDVSRLTPVVPAIKMALSMARKAGVPVIWLRACYENPLLPPSMLQQKRSRNIDAVCCARGSWGYEFFAVTPEPGEQVFEKHTYSGFSNPYFEEHLRSLDVETLLFSGVQTNVCVESTLRDAHSRGFNVAVLKDGAGSHTLALHEATLANVTFLFGDVCSIREIAEIWTS